MKATLTALSILNQTAPASAATGLVPLQSIGSVYQLWRTNNNNQSYLDEFQCCSNLNVSQMYTNPTAYMCVDPEFTFSGISGT